MKKFFLYFSALAMAGALVFSCDKNKGNTDDPTDGPEPPEPAKELYVSPEGAGLQDGSSAENAMSFDGLQDLVMAAIAPTEPAVEPGPAGDTEPPVTDDPVVPQPPLYENLDLIDGYTVIFAVGTYVTPRNDEDLAGLEIALPGAPEAIAITFKGSTEAILSGAERARVLTIGSQVNLSIKGMTIKNGKLEEGNGGGISISSGEGEEARLTLDGTVFTNNQVSTSSSGGAIHCGKAVVSASKCVFEADNYGRNGGSIFTNNNAAVVNCKDCTFKSHSFNTGGAANNSKGEQHYKDCIFEGCYTETGNGGAIHANEADVIVTVEGCQFKSCKARINDPMETSTGKGAGIISVQQAEFTIDDCVFEDCEAVTGALIYLQAGNGSTGATGGWVKCNNTRFIGNRGADRGLIQANGSKGNKQGAIGFFNNCVFYNNTMRTNQWGFILHGGNPGIACFNNCTIYGNERQQEGGNGVLLNSDGLTIFTNSTLIGAADLVAIRSTDTSNDTRFLLANSLIINTSTIKTPLVFGPFNKMKIPLYAYNNIMGPAIDDTDVNLTGKGNIYDASLESLGNGAFDADKFVYTWKGPDDTFTKITPTEFETAVKASMDKKFTDFNAYIGDNTIGEFYYAWLTEIGALGKDALGNDRGDAWWPGAYQN